MSNKSTLLIGEIQTFLESIIDNNTTSLDWEKMCHIRSILIRIKELQKEEK